MTHYASKKKNGNETQSRTSHIEAPLVRCVAVRSNFCAFYFSCDSFWTVKMRSELFLYKGNGSSALVLIHQQAAPCLLSGLSLFTRDKRRGFCRRRPCRTRLALRPLSNDITSSPAYD
ncbi:hypothetical protein KIN20_025410 [Parelaphostrongylus tenuis]|uniref:Uncharacterized protein n=1 Tax=Parelaphostrongylus tenuis TaxID=148309 RepID=A0AAD5NAS2_PARTN|nr:hypothetical protein KIN20_025410 [Parelaphostrongylus tenuis]